MRSLSPLIGVFCRPLNGSGPPDTEQVQPYVDAIEANGGQALVLTVGGLEPAAIVDHVDGLLLPGGAEVDPALYGAARTWKQTAHFSAAFDRYEVATLQLALPIGVPVLGICRGLQLLNVVTGGTLHQDISRDMPNRAALIEHSQQRLPAFKHGKAVDKASPSHEIRLEPEVAGRVPILAGLLGNGPRQVNSTHHQAIDRVSPLLAVAARAADGVIEAVELRQHDRVWAMQSHPERQRLVDPRFDGVFKKLIADAAERAAHPLPSTRTFGSRQP
jgi:putative glutamine amidotransferase